MPAVRLPIKKCEDNNKSGVNSVLSLCVDAFESSGNPQDLSDMWQYVSNLKPSNFPINEQVRHSFMFAASFYFSFFIIFFTKKKKLNDGLLYCIYLSIPI